MERKDANGNYIGEPRSIARLPRDNGVALDPINPDGSFTNEDSKNKYSWGGYNPATVLGDLNAAKGKAQGNYFQIDNVLGIMAQRASKLYQKNPGVARPYFERIANLAEAAYKIRKIENQNNTAKAFRTYLEQYEKKNKVKNNLISGNPSLIRTTITTEPNDPNSWSSGWRYSEINAQATKDNWPQTAALKSHKEAIMGGGKKAKRDANKEEKTEIKLFADRWARGDFSEMKNKGGKTGDNNKNKEERKPLPNMGNYYTHLQAQRAEEKLAKGIREQIADPSKVFGTKGCEWYKLRDPGEGGIRDPVKKRLAVLTRDRGLEADMTSA